MLLTKGGAEAEPETARGPREPQNRVRPRAYIAGVLSVVLVCLVVSYSELAASRSGSVDAILLGATHLPPGAVAGLIALIVTGAALGRFAPSLRLLPCELTVIYYMMACAALLCSFGLAAQLLPNLVGINYFANPGNRWSESFFPGIRPWLVPWDPSGQPRQAVTVAYYEGMRLGESVPWGKWMVPLCCWTVLALLLFFFMACVATIFRKVWADDEHLSFPLVQLPVEMAGAGQPPFFRNPIMWAGCILAASFHCMNGVHNALPWVPHVPVIFVLNDYLVGKPWSSLYYTPIVIVLSVVGFAYLLPLDVSFSFWFFLLAFRTQDIAAGLMGYEPVDMPLYPARLHIGYQSAGAFFVVAGSMIWFARGHLSSVVRHALRATRVRQDEDEVMSYGVAFWGGLISFVLVIVWCWAAGMSPGVAALMMGAYAVIVLVLTRCVAEVGLLMLQPIFRPSDIWALGASPAALGVPNITVLALLNGAFYRDPRTLMPTLLDGMKAAELARTPRRQLGIAVLLAVVVGIVAAYSCHLIISYQMGGLSLNEWFYRDNPNHYFNEARRILDAPPQLNPMAPLYFAVGSIVTLALYALRTRFWWWPFHPLGYAMGAAWPAVVYWSAFFVGWCAKAVIIRYGGARSYHVARPFFLGLILGEFGAGIAWAAISAVTGVTPPAIPMT